MAGNVWEWTDSVFMAEHDWRAVRGGSWSGDWDFARASYRLNFSPNFRGGFIGFRMCVSNPLSRRSLNH
jgi:formylglycine-generating enzyme required for sulfatase activity